jgi:hypothetical protein
MFLSWRLCGCAVPNSVLPRRVCWSFVAPVTPGRAVGRLMQLPQPRRDASAHGQVVTRISAPPHWDIQTRTPGQALRVPLQPEFWRRHQLRAPTREHARSVCWARTQMHCPFHTMNLQRCHCNSCGIPRECHQCTGGPLTWYSASEDGGSPLCGLKK